MTTKKPNNPDEDNFFDDDIFDSDLFDDDDIVVQAPRSSSSKQKVNSKEESLFDDLLLDRMDVKPTSRKAVMLDNFEEDQTEVIMDDEFDGVLPNTYLTDDRGKVFNVKRSPFTIGRSIECDLVLNVKGVSRKHAELSYGGGHFVLRDLDSLNGTRINGTPVHQTRLNDADVIQFGQHKLNFFTDTLAGKRPSRQFAASARANKASPVVAASETVAPSVQSHKSNDLLVKVNIVIVIFTIIVALSYVMLEDYENSQLEKAQATLNQDKLNLPKLPNIPSDLLQVDVNDWTQTGQLPQSIGESDFDRELEEMARLVEAQLRGEELSTSTSRSRRATDSKLKSEVEKIKQTRGEQTKRDAEAAEAAEREREAALKAQSEQETRDGEALLQSIREAYLSGDKFSSQMRDMKALSESTKIGARLKRKLANTHEVYDSLRSRYLEGNKLYEEGSTDAAFTIWQEMLASEKQIIGLKSNENSYYNQQISERAFNMTAQKAEAAEQRGDLKEAIKLYTRLSKLKPNSGYKAKIEEMSVQIDARFDRAEKVMAENPAEAVKLLQSVIDSTSRDNSMHIRAEAKLLWLKEGL